MIKTEIKQILNDIEDMFETKNDQYGSKQEQDEFYNFRQQALRTFGNDDPESMYKILKILVDKHLVTLNKNGLDDSNFEERCIDVIVYHIIYYQKRHHTGELWNTFAFIDTKTLSQYTGIDFERSGVFENDLFKWTSTDTDGSEMVTYFRVVFKDGCYYAKVLKPYTEFELLKDFVVYNSEYEKLELLGSIFDHKELLEVENDSKKDR